MKKMYVTSGIPGSGKSTWAKSFVRSEAQRGHNVVYISRDEIREELFMAPTFSKKEEKSVRNLFFKRIANALDQGEDVLADATHLNPGSRRMLWRCAEAHAVEVEFVHVHVSISTALKRNAQRTGIARVPDAVIRSMAADFVLPTQAEVALPMQVRIVENE